MESQVQTLAGALLTVALFGVTGALFVAVCIGMLVKGPVRWVKIASALLAVLFVANMALLGGARQALTVVATMVAVSVGAMAVGTIIWSQPRRKSFQPASPAACPAHARDRFERWSAELGSLGFAFHSDQAWQWQFGGSPRNGFVRFFRHSSEPMRAELHALESPKVAARMVASLTGDGRTLTTCDQQSDVEFFPRSSVEVQRVASRASVEEMVQAHRAAAERLGSAAGTEDPVAAHLDSYHRWVDEQVEGGSVTVRGDRVGMRPAAIPGAILRVFSAWFH